MPSNTLLFEILTEFFHSPAEGHLGCLMSEAAVKVHPQEGADAGLQPGYMKSCLKSSFFLVPSENCK